MTATLRTAAAAVVAALAAGPAAAFESATDRLPGFRSVGEASGAVEVAVEVASRAEAFAPLALVAVAALYVATESRVFRGR